MATFHDNNNDNKVVDDRATSTRRVVVVGSRPRDLLSSSSSLLPLHPHKVSAEDAERYFVSLEREFVRPSVAASFWSEAHYLACARRGSFVATPFHARSAVRSGDGGEHDDAGVREALAWAVARDRRDAGRELVTIDDDEPSSSSSSLFSPLSLLAARRRRRGVSADEAADRVARRWRMLRRANSSATTTTTTPRTTDRRAASSSFAATPRKIASALTRSVVSVLAAYDVVDDHAIDDDDDDDESSRRAEEEDDDASALPTPLRDDDAVLSVDLAAECCDAIANHVGSGRVAADDREGTYYRTIRGTIVLSRGGPRESETRGTWSAFCRLVGEDLLREIDDDDDWRAFARARLLSRIRFEDADAAASALLRAGVVRSSEDGALLGLTLGDVDDDDDVPRSLDDVETALYRLARARDSLERRVEALSERADDALATALRLRRSTRAADVPRALAHMRRRARFRAERDRCGDALLNVEASLEALERSASNAELTATLETCRDAFAATRTAGGDAGDVDDLMEELRERAADANAIDDALGESRTWSTADDVDEEELARELAALSVEEEKAIVSPAEVKKTPANPDTSNDPALEQRPTDTPANPEHDADATDESVFEPPTKTVTVKTEETVLTADV